MDVVLIAGRTGIEWVQADIATPTGTAVPDKILFIGNDFTFSKSGLKYHLPNLASSAQPPLKLDVEAITIGGATLKQLWANGAALDAIRTGDWDAVVLQENSSALQSEIFPEYVHRFDEEIQKAGAQTVLYMARGSTFDSVEDIARDYNAVAGEVGATVAPAALACQRVKDAAPNLQLHDSDRRESKFNGNVPCDSGFLRHALQQESRGTAICACR